VCRFRGVSVTILGARQAPRLCVVNAGQLGVTLRIGVGGIVFQEVGTFGTTVREATGLSARGVLRLGKPMGRCFW